MASIQTAAKWMLEEDQTGGKMVRRASWPQKTYMLTINADGFIREGYANGIFEDSSSLDELSPEDLMADDWETVEAS